MARSDNPRARHEPPSLRAASVATGNRAAAAGEPLASLRHAGRDESLARITVTMLGDSLGMQRDSRMAGFTLKHAEGTDEFHAELTL